MKEDRKKSKKNKKKQQQALNQLAQKKTCIYEHTQHHSYWLETQIDYEAFLTFIGLDFSLSPSRCFHF